MWSNTLESIRLQAFQTSAGTTLKERRRVGFLPGGLFWDLIVSLEAMSSGWVRPENK